MTEFRKRYQQYIEDAVRRLPKDLADRITALLSDPSNIQTVGLWTSAIAAGLVAVTYAKLFRWAEHIFVSYISKSGFISFLVAPLLFFLAWFLVRKFAPEAAGSGIPQIMAANETDYQSENRGVVDRLLSLRTALVKVLSSLLCVVGGGAIGREGPTLQICTSVFHFFGCQVRRFLPQTSEHTWVVAGAASGLASAFNTPLGGIVYAIEELGLVHFHKVRTALLSGVIVSGLVSQWLIGSYLYLGYPALNKAGIEFVPWAILNGLIAGGLGAVFGKMLLSLVSQRSKILDSKKLLIVTLSAGFIMASLNYLDPRSSGTGTSVITDLLFEGEKAELKLIILRYFGTIITYLSGAAGGIFSPSLAVGASIGSFLSRFVGTDNGNLMVLLGMISFLTGVTRTPFTAFILVLEMTDRHRAIFPMMLAALSAQWISQFIDRKSFYEHIKATYLISSSPKK